MAEPTAKITLVALLSATAIGQAAPIVAEFSITILAAIFGAAMGLSMASKGAEWKGPARHIMAGVGFGLIGSPLLASVGARVMSVDFMLVLPIAAALLGLFWRETMALVPAMLSAIPGLIDKWRK